MADDLKANPVWETKTARLVKKYELWMCCEQDTSVWRFDEDEPSVQNADVKLSLFQVLKRFLYSFSNEYWFYISSFIQYFKGTVNVISSDPPCLEALSDSQRYP